MSFAAGRPVRYAVAGAGIAASTHARELAHVSGAVLEAVYARDPEKAERFRRSTGARAAYSDLDHLLADPAVDAVVVATPNGLHRDIALAAAAAGKHVVVEKPLEISSARAREIIAACRAAGVHLFVVYQMRFAAASERARQAIDGGELGRVILVNVIDNEYRPPEYYARDAWRGTLAVEGGGCLMTQSIHLLDLVQDLVGPVAATFALTRTAVHEIETEDLAVATMRFENGALGVLSSTTAGYPAQRHLVSIVGTDGTVMFNGEHDRIVFSATRGRSDVVDLPTTVADSADPLDFPTFGQRRQLQSITDAIASGAPPAIRAEEHLRAIRLLEAIYLSSRQGREVLLAELP